MFRTIIALLLTLVVAIIIGAFQILFLDITDIQAILQNPNLTTELASLGSSLFAALIFPYTFAMSGAFAPLVALGVAGFIAGLISKSGARMLVVSIIALVLFFLGYALLSMGAALELTSLASLAQTIAIDLGVSFGLLFIPGVIGASLTAEDY